LGLNSLTQLFAFFINSICLFFDSVQIRFIQPDSSCIEIHRLSCMILFSQLSWSVNRIMFSCLTQPLQCNPSLVLHSNGYSKCFPNPKITSQLISKFLVQETLVHMIQALSTQREYKSE